MSLPLVSRLQPTDTVAWCDGHAVSVADFVADVAHLRAALPAGRHVLNVCGDRYRFLVGFAAAAVDGRVSLLPSTRNADTIAQLRAFAPDAFCLCDSDTDIELPQMRYVARDPGRAPEPAPLPRIEADRVVAQVFTSGSTAAPVPHLKRWGALVRGAGAEAEQLGLLDGARHNLVGTVPPQHMYGFESTALLALHGGVAASNASPLYPADVAAALCAVPAPRMLVTSPVHLRALLDSGLPLPPLHRVLSATAPLPAELAQRAEAQLHAPLLEIYGSTETGQLALRRPARDTVWTLFPGITLQPDARGLASISGAHSDAPQVLHDRVRVVDARRFELLGRSADMVNIAGKRSSLEHLNHQLRSIPGVLDGVFVAPEQPEGSAVRRLTALVVAPGLTPQALRAALRARIDAAFMPRPLLFVDALPRNATGKLPLQALHALVRSCVGADAH